MNYSETVALVKDALENQETSFADNIDQMVRLAERRIHLTLQLPSAFKHSTSTMDMDVEYISLPPDVISIFDVATVTSNVYNFLSKVDEAFIREAYPDRSVTGTPKYYTVFDDLTIIFGPTPDMNYTVELSYHGVPDSIVDVGNTWLGDNCGRALFYAIMCEGYMYMKGDPDLLAKYEESYREEIMKLNNIAAKPARADDLFDMTPGNARSN